MYYPFLQTEFNPIYYYCLTDWNPSSQIIKQTISEPRQQQFSADSIKIEEKDAEYIQQQFLDNISITVKDLRQAGYEKKKQAWTEEEDSKLLRLAKNGIKWSQVSESMDGRSIKMCYSRFKRLQKRGQDRRGYWTSEQDKRLVRLVDSYGQNWKELSLYFESRKPKQLRQRYINALTPNISKQPWTLEEDMKLIELYNMFGKRWKSIAEELQKRSENQVKNRFYGRILPLQLKKKKRK